MGDLTEQAKRLAKRLEAIPAAIVAELRPALIRAVDDLADTMKAIAPEDEGDLKASIEVTPPGGTTPAYAVGGGSRMAGDNQALVTVGNPKMRHGHLQEFGTVNHEARPFMRPATRMNRDRMQRRIGRAVAQAIRKVGGQNA